MKKTNLLPEEIRDNENLSKPDSGKMQGKPFKYHMPIAEKQMPKTILKTSEKPKVQLQEKPKIAVVKEINPQVKKQDPKRNFEVKERRVIKEKKEQKEYETKNYLEFFKKKQKQTVMEKPATLEVNLIPEEFLVVPIFLFKLKLFSLLKITLSFILFFLLGYSGLSYYVYTLNNQNSELNAQISEIDQEIKKFYGVKERIIQLQDQSQNILSLLNQHVYWTKFFEKLEDTTNKDIFFSDFSAERNGSIVMSGKGKSYQAIAKQLVAFQQADDFVQSVEISSASAQKTDQQIESINFTSSINLIPDLLYFQDENLPPPQEEENIYTFNESSSVQVKNSDSNSVQENTENETSESINEQPIESIEEASNESNIETISANVIPQEE